MPFRKSFSRGFKRSYGGVRKGTRASRSTTTKSLYTGRTKEEIKLTRLAAIGRDPQLQAQIGLVTGSLQDERTASVAIAFLDLLDRGFALLEAEQQTWPEESTEGQEQQPGEEEQEETSSHSSQEEQGTSGSGEECEGKQQFFEGAFNSSDSKELKEVPKEKKTLGGKPLKPIIAGWSQTQAAGKKS